MRGEGVRRLPKLARLRAAGTHHVRDERRCQLTGRVVAQQRRPCVQQRAGQARGQRVRTKEAAHRACAAAARVRGMLGRAALALPRRIAKLEHAAQTLAVQSRTRACPVQQVHEHGHG
jgi:hypothetical protein